MPDDKLLEELKKYRNKLRKDKKLIIEKIKTEHKDFYTWLIEHQIDLTNLNKYSASIATALAITVSGLAPVETIAPQLTPQVKIIQPKELYGLNEEEKGKLVWKRYGHIIKRVSRKYALDSGLIFATIMIESGGNTYAVRYEPQINDASYGLGQILFGTAAGLEYEGNPNGLFDPEVNIELIGRYHRRNMDVYGNLSPQQLTTAYNTGSPYNYALPGHVEKFNKWFNKVNNFMI